MTAGGPAALVVFHGRGHGRVGRLLKPGFRHCFVCLRDPRGYWIRFDGRGGIPELRVEAGGGFDLAGHFRDLGFAVAECAAPGARAPRQPLMLGTCVGAAKRLLGLRACLVLTPWQLWRRLTRNTRTEPRRSRWRRPVSRTC